MCFARSPRPLFGAAWANLPFRSPLACNCSAFFLTLSWKRPPSPRLTPGPLPTGEVCFLTPALGLPLPFLLDALMPIDSFAMLVFEASLSSAFSLGNFPAVPGAHTLPLLHDTPVHETALELLRMLLGVVTAAGVLALALILAVCSFSACSCLSLS